MADFCLQCAHEIFGDDVPSDFYSIVPEGKFCRVICEGCGACIVNSSGECTSTCMRHHGLTECNPYDISPHIGGAKHD